MTTEIECACAACPKSFTLDENEQYNLEISGKTLICKDCIDHSNPDNRPRITISNLESSVNDQFRE